MKHRALTVATLAALTIACQAPEAPDPKAGRADAFAAAAPVVVSEEVPGLPTGCTSVTSEGETMLAVDPADPRHLVATWTAGAWNGANTAITAVSFDGGKRWSRSWIANTGPCSGGTRDHVIDQWVGIDGGGRAYYHSFSGTEDSEVAKHTLVSTSDDGRAWNAAAVLDDNLQGATGVISRTSITADPYSADRAWAVWSRLLNPATDGALVARTDDGGVTWSAPVTAARSTGGAAAAWQLVVMPSGTLALFYGEADTTATAVELLPREVGGVPPITNRVVTSGDGGQTWSAPSTINVAPEFVVGRAAAAPDGTLHFVWSELADGTASVRMASSRDGGASWGAPATVSAFAAGPLGILDIQADVAVSEDGVIGMSFYRSAGDAVTRAFASSSDGGTHWSELPLAAPFAYDTGTGGTRDGVFGAYQGLVALGRDFGAFFVASTINPENPTEVVFVRVDRRAGH